MKRLLFSLITLSIISSTLSGMEKSIQAQRMADLSELPFALPEAAEDSNPAPPISEERIANFASAIGLGYISVLGNVLVHELGHKLAYTLLTGKSASIDVSFFPPSGIAMPHDLNSAEVEGWKGFSIAMAGPLFGTCAALGSLKFANIISEKLKGKSTKEAIIAGLKKPFFNREQPLWLRIAAGFDLYSQIESIVPVKIGYMGNDGYRALDSIGKPFAINHALANLLKK